MPLTLSLSQPAASERTPATSARTLLTQLRAGCPTLTPFVPAADPPGGRHLAEVEAVARAAACPDLFLVHTADPAAGERLIVELVRTCGRERVLVLSPNPAAADRIVETLSRSGETSLVRALGDDENPIRPLPLAGKHTAAVLQAAYAERLRRDAEAAVAAADARLTLLEKLCDYQDTIDRVERQRAELLAHRATLEPTVRAEAAGSPETPVAIELARLRAEHETRLAELDARRSSLEAAADLREAATAALRRQHAEALAEAARKPGLFARLLGKGKTGPDPEELEGRIRAGQAEADSLRQQAAALRAEIDAACARHQAEQESLIARELEARCRDTDARLASLAAEAERLRHEADTLRSRIPDLPPGPADLAALRYGATRDLVVARERAAETTRTADQSARSAVRDSRVVVGTPGSLHSDPTLDGVDPAHGPPFALLVLDRAEELTEAVFCDLVDLAARCVLVGHAITAEPPRPHPGGKKPPPRHARPPEPPFLARLARLLDRETWAEEGGHLVCRLHHTPPDERRHLTREPLLDSPEIELRFATTAEDAVVLAEVVFPPGRNIAAAKSFLFRQLGEVLLRPCGPYRRQRTENGLRVCWPTVEALAGEVTWIDLEPGVHEALTGTGTAVYTVAVTFDSSAGWDEERVTEWLATHVPTASASRLAVLPALATAPSRHPR